MESLPERVERWRKAGLIDAAQAGRILEFEGRAPAERGGISVVEVIAYIGSLVVLAGLGFLYGSQFQLLGPSGRLTLVILVTVATLAIGLRIAAGQARPPLRRARAVALAVSVIAVDWLVIQLQYEQNPQVFSRDCCDAALQLFFNSSLAATLAAAIFLTWTGTGLLAFVFAVYADSSTGLFLSFQHGSPGWPAEVPWLVDVAVVLLAAERARSRRRRWAAEVLAYAASATLALSLISIGNASGRLEMELLGGVAGLAALAAAIWRSSPGYAIGGGFGVFGFVVDIEVHYFANSLGFAAILVISGLVLLAIAFGLARLLPRLRTGHQPLANSTPDRLT